MWKSTLTTKGVPMGHSYSEMHVTTPHEEYQEKVRLAREQFGFTNYDVDYRHWFVCRHCSCMILQLLVHIPNCVAIDQTAKDNFINMLEAAKYQIIASLCKQACEAETEPETNPWLGRKELLDICIDAEITAFAFDIVMHQLESAGSIAQYHEPVDYGWQMEYRDRKYLLAEPKEQP